MFTEEFRERLRQGKYTSWASDLTPEQLEGLLWALDEYVSRCPPLGRVSQEMLAAGAAAGLPPRAQTGLKAVIECVANRRRRTLDEVLVEIRAATYGPPPPGT